MKNLSIYQNAAKEMDKTFYSANLTTIFGGIILMAFPFFFAAFHQPVSLEEIPAYENKLRDLGYVAGLGIVAFIFSLVSLYTYKPKSI
jgi:hypothetical protein